MFHGSDLATLIPNTHAVVGVTLVRGSSRTHKVAVEALRGTAELSENFGLAVVVDTT